MERGISVLRRLLRRGQVTIPSVILVKFGLKEKDYVKVEATKDGILIKPVTVSDYSPAELETLREKLDQLSRGKKTAFRSFSEGKKHLDSLKQ